MIALTPLLFLMSPREAVPTLMMLSMLNTAPIAFSNREKIRLGIVGPLLSGAIFGVPLGLAAIVYLDGPVFRTLVGMLLLLFAVILAAGINYPLPRPHIASVPVGFLSGVMTGSTSMGGPPVILFLANQSIPKEVFRTNIVTYFSCANVVSIGLAASQDMIDSGVLAQTALFAPLLLAGTYAGSKLAGRTSEMLFRQITLACAGVMGCILLIRSIPELLD